MDSVFLALRLIKRSEDIKTMYTSSLLKTPSLIDCRGRFFLLIIPKALKRQNPFKNIDLSFKGIFKMKF